MELGAGSANGRADPAAGGGPPAAGAGAAAATTDRRGTKDSLKALSEGPDSRRGTKESKASDWAPTASSPRPEAQVVLPPWRRRFAAQFPALFKKHMLVQWRNRRATILRVLAPL